MIKPRSENRERGDPAAFATAPQPDRAASVVLLGPLTLEQRLGTAVAALLAEVRADAVAPAVPHHRGGAEAERPAGFLEPPADVDVVARDPELLVEAADRLERLLAEGH